MISAEKFLRRFIVDMYIHFDVIKRDSVCLKEITEVPEGPFMDMRYEMEELVTIMAREFKFRIDCLSYKEIELLGLRVKDAKEHHSHLVDWDLRTLEEFEKMDSDEYVELKPIIFKDLFKYLQHSSSACLELVINWSSVFSDYESQLETIAHRADYNMGALSKQQRKKLMISLLHELLRSFEKEQRNESIFLARKFIDDFITWIYCDWRECFKIREFMEEIKYGDPRQDEDETRELVSKLMDSETGCLKTVQNFLSLEGNIGYRPTDTYYTYTIKQVKYEDPIRFGDIFSEPFPEPVRFHWRPEEAPKVFIDFINKGLANMDERIIDIEQKRKKQMGH